MDETREQYLERIINGSTAYINVKERREEKVLSIQPTTLGCPLVHLSDTRQES